MQQQDEKLDAEDIKLEIKDCSLFILFEHPDTYIRLHGVIHETIKLFCHDRRSDLKIIFISETPMNGPVFSSQNIIQNGLG